MHDLLDLAKVLYWWLVFWATLVILYIVAFHEPPRYWLLIPIALVALVVLATWRSWYGLALMLGVAIIAALPFYLRTYAGW
jgi:hypothetical protein